MVCDHIFTTKTLATIFFPSVHQLGARRRSGEEAGPPGTRARGHGRGGAVGMEGPGYEGAYGMKFQARALAAVEADPGRSRWLVGSTALREDPNELHLVQHGPAAAAAEASAALSTLAAVAVFPHAAGEVWDVAPAPAGLDPGLCFTAHAAGRRHGATLWRLRGLADDDEAGGEAGAGEGRLEAEAALGVPEGQRVRRVAWGGDEARVAAVSERQVRAGFGPAGFVPPRGLARLSGCGRR